VARDDQRVEVAGVQPLADRRLEGARAAARQVGAADATAEQGVAREQERLLARHRHLEADRSRRVPRGVDHRRGPLAERDHIAVIDEPVDRCHRPGLEPEEGRLHGDAVVEEQVALVQADVPAVGLLHVPGAQDVIDMGVGMDDGPHRQVVSGDDLSDPVQLPARVDHHSIFRISARQDRAVTLQGPGGKSLS
jgi:hypothetical protein